MDTVTIARAILNVVNAVLLVAGGFVLGIAFHSWRVQKCIKENEEDKKTNQEEA